jgi:hypothetical protein
VPRGIVNTDTNNLAPRLAVVWDPKGNGRTSVRAAWGIFYDALAGQGDFFQSGVLSPPFTPAGRAEHAHADHDREPARCPLRRAEALPRRPDHHRLG